MNYSFETQGPVTYLSVELDPNEVIDSFTMGMLSNNHIIGFAPVLYTEFDGRRYLKYNISAKLTASQFFSGNITPSRAIEGFKKILDAICIADEYMIDSSCFDFRADHVFINISSCEVALICLPLATAKNANTEIANLFKFLLTAADIYDHPDMEKLKFVLDTPDRFNLYNFKSIVESWTPGANPSVVSGSPQLVTPKLNNNQQQGTFKPQTPPQAKPEPPKAATPVAPAPPAQPAQPAQPTQPKPPIPATSTPAAPKENKPVMPESSGYMPPKLNGGSSAPSNNSGNVDFDGTISMDQAPKIFVQSRLHDEKKPEIPSANKKDDKSPSQFVTQSPNNIGAPKLNIPGKPPVIPARPNFDRAPFPGNQQMPGQMPQGVNRPQGMAPMNGTPGGNAVPGRPNIPGNPNMPGRPAIPGTPVIPGTPPMPPTRPGAPIPPGNQAQQPEKKQSVFDKLFHGNKTNNAQGGYEKKSKNKKKTKNENILNVPGQPNQAPVPKTVPAGAIPNQMRPGTPFNPQAPGTAVPYTAAPQQSAAPNQGFNLGSNQGARPISNSFNDTVVLSNPVGDTTVLSDANQMTGPYITRIKTGEKISIDKPVFRIGKERNYVDFFIPDNTAISRSHANIITIDGEFFIEDTNSTNHTFVNGKMINANEKFKLSNGDTFRLANEDFCFFG